MSRGPGGRGNGERQGEGYGSWNNTKVKGFQEGLRDGEAGEGGGRLVREWRTGDEGWASWGGGGERIRSLGKSLDVEFVNIMIIIIIIIDLGAH